MAEKYRDESGQMLEPGKINAAKSYTDNMIFQPLHRASQYEQAAKFGASEIVEQLEMPSNMKTQARISAIKNLLFTLQQLGTNVRFSIEEKDQEGLQTQRNALEKIEKYYIEKVSTIRRRGDVTRVDIEEKKFNATLKKLQQIREKISEYIDNAQLIYFKKEAEMTEDERDEWIKEMVENRG